MEEITTPEKPKPNITAAEISDALGGSRCGAGYLARCPAHDDSTPSLSIADGQHAPVIVHCYAGCSQTAVIAALRKMGLWMDGKPMSDAEHRQTEKRVAARQREQKKAHAAAAKRARDIAWWETVDAPADHPYLCAKKLPPRSLRMYTGHLSIGHLDVHGALVVPLVDPDGDVASLQFIAANGEKRFLRDARTEGCSWCARGATPERYVVVGEGWASVVSVAEALADLEPTAIAAMSAANLPQIARMAGEWHPDAKIVIAADNDAETAGNPGLAAGVRAQRVAGGVLAVPDLGSNRSCDWSDMFVDHGAEVVRRLIEDAMRHASREKRGKK